MRTHGEVPQRGARPFEDVDVVLVRMLEHDEEDIVSEVEEIEWARHSGVVEWGERENNNWRLLK